MLKPSFAYILSRQGYYPQYSETKMLRNLRECGRFATLSKFYHNGKGDYGFVYETVDIVCNKTGINWGKFGGRIDIEYILGRGLRPIMTHTGGNRNHKHVYPLYSGSQAQRKNNKDIVKYNLCLGQADRPFRYYLKEGDFAGTLQVVYNLFKDSCIVHPRYVKKCADCNIPVYDQIVCDECKINAQ